MNDLERFYACFNYEPVDRHPFWYFGYWAETRDRWIKEGWNRDEFDPSEGADKAPMYGNWFDPQPPFTKEIVSEDEEHVTFINHEGVLVREMKNNPSSSMPQFLRFPVETREDFRRFWSERMQPDMNRKMGPDWKEQLKSIRALEQPFIVWAANWGGFFGPLRHLLGVENICMMFYDDPDFIEEMMDADAEYIISIMSQILDVVSVDCFQYWEDMAYNVGPLISPELARKYMLPRYRKVNEYLYGRGVKFIGLDSDGKIEDLIPVWLDAGLNYLFPFEVQCGMDVIRVRREYGRELRIVGGVDKRALKQGPAAIDAELERVRPLIEEGGYIPMLDHTVPPDVSFEDYRHYVKKIKEVCEVRL